MLMKIKNIYILKRGGYKMDKQQFIKSMNLHKKLKEKIKGCIYIEIKDNSLFINIKNHGITFKKKINDISNAMDINKYVDSIKFEYWEFVRNEFFIKI